jgi:GAF domain-containing protein
VQAAIPDCVCISITLLDAGLTFTLTTTSEALRVVDAVQYLDGGPCQAAALDDVETHVEDVLDEDRWQRFAQTSAANGVRSTLSIPIRRAAGELHGSVNLYASSPSAFAQHEQELATMFGAAAAEAVANADLSMLSVQRAEEAPARIHDADTVSVAVGLFAARDAIPLDAARERFLDAAARAGTSPTGLAELIISEHEADLKTPPR